MYRVQKVDHKLNNLLLSAVSWIQERRRLSFTTMNTDSNSTDQLLSHAPSFPSLASIKRRTCNDADIPSHALVKSLELKKSSHIRDFLKASCAKSILSHVLFSRGVIPCPADHLLNAKDRIKKSKKENESSGVGSKRKRKRSDAVRERKYEKHGEQLQSVFSALDAIFRIHCSIDIGTDESNIDNEQLNEDSAVKALLITLGPSFSSPREQYLIRFQEWENDASNASKNFSSIPSDVQYRLGCEMGRRCVREIICGTLEEMHASMFELRVTGNDVKVNLACLVSEVAVQRLLHPITSSDSSSNVEPAIANSQIDVFQAYNMNQGVIGNTYLTSIPFVVNRRLEVREPRMYSKKRGIHRPFAVLDVIPALKPSAYNGECKAPKFEQRDTDVWISLRPYIKGFRI